LDRGPWLGAQSSSRLAWGSEVLFWVHQGALIQKALIQKTLIQKIIIQKTLIQKAWMAAPV